jgi:hypothetical protein
LNALNFANSRPKTRSRRSNATDRDMSWRA